MNAAEETATTSGPRLTLLGTALLALALLATGCIVDSPSIESTQVGTQASQAAATAVVQPTVAAPVFEPTAVPAPPTAVVEPTATEVPAATPEPEPDPVPAATPLAVEGADSDFLPTEVAAGPVAVPVASSQFELSQARPILQLPGHSLIYLDDRGQSEVDIFTPFAAEDGTELGEYDQVLDHLRTSPRFAYLTELEPATIAGSPGVVFEGVTAYDPESPVRAFITDQSSASDPVLGWYLPERVQMWVIDSPAGPVIVTAESLEDPGEFDDAFALANSILDTLVFG